MISALKLFITARPELPSDQTRERIYTLDLLLLRPQRQWGLICCVKGSVLLLLYTSLLEAVKTWFQNIPTNTLKSLPYLFAVILLLFLLF